MTPEAIPSLSRVRGRTEAPAEPIAPFDIWGTVGKVVANGESTVEVTLQDDADRPVPVSGIEAESLQPGHRVWFFDLEPTQTLPHQGVFV